MTITLNGSEGITLDNGYADGAQVTLSSSGYNDCGIDNYNGTLRAYNNGTEQFKVTNTGNLQFNSGYGSVATAYGCRAWVNFNGTGTVAIRASGNVSSITDNGTGDYTVNFTTAMSDANYSACAFGVADAVNQTVVGTNIGFHPTGTSTWVPSLKTTTQARIIIGRGNAAGLYDISDVSFQIFR